MRDIRNSIVVIVLVFVSVLMLIASLEYTSNIINAGSEPVDYYDSGDGSVSDGSGIPSESPRTRITENKAAMVLTLHSCWGRVTRRSSTRSPQARTPALFWQSLSLSPRRWRVLRRSFTGLLGNADANRLWVCQLIRQRPLAPRRSPRGRSKGSTSYGSRKSASRCR